MGLIARHLRGLIDFRGRENRQPFWLWVLIVVAVQTVISMVAMFALVMPAFSAMIAAAQRDPAYLNAHPGMPFEVMGSTMRTMMTANAVFALLFTAMLAAAMIRRFHDGDRSGWWVAPQLALQVLMPLFYATMMPNFFDAFARMQPGDAAHNDAAFQQLAQTMAPLSVLGALSFLALVGTVVFLALPGTVGPNRFGSDPLRG